MENKFSKEEQNKQLILIPKVEDYIEYILTIIMKIPRIEKFSIGNEYKRRRAFNIPFLPGNFHLENI